MMVSLWCSFQVSPKRVPSKKTHLYVNELSWDLVVSRSGLFGLQCCQRPTPARDQKYFARDGSRNSGTAEQQPVKSRRAAVAV